MIFSSEVQNKVHLECFYYQLMAAYNYAIYHNIIYYMQYGIRRFPSVVLQNFTTTRFSRRVALRFTGALWYVVLRCRLMEKRP